MNESNAYVNRVLDALSNQVRRDILLMLREGPMPVGTIATHFSISRPAISKHLRILQEADLVGYNINGTSNVFYPKPTGFRDLRVYLDLFWDDALAHFKRFAEGNRHLEP